MIEVKNLTKRFGPKLAVDNVSFTVEKGQVLGFLGPNGAGKSTTMRMITGFFPPTAGEVSVAGIDAIAHPRKAKAKIGYLPENAPLYTDMSVVSFLKFCGRMRGLSGGNLSRAVDRALDMCCLQRVRNQSVDTLSKGFKHRTCFAQSIIHDPEILILDEPTDGLDPNQKHEVRNLIRRMGEEKAILFSTHILEEVEAACTRAMIIDQGRVVADGTPDELRARDLDAGSLTVAIHGASGASVRQGLANLAACESVEESRSTDTELVARLRARPGAGSLAEQVYNHCRERGYVMTDLSVESGRLDNVFRQITVSDTATDAANTSKETDAAA